MLGVRLLPPSSRTRHLVPSWALALLGLLFRYSYAHDAWVLRGIGEGYGPVLDVQRSRASSAAPPRSPSRLRRRGAFTRRLDGTWRPMIEVGLLIGAGAVIAAGAGYALAHHAATVNRMPALTDRAATATFALARPADWRRQPPPADVVALLSTTINLAAPGPGRGSLTAGVAQTPDPQLLPSAVLAGLSSVPKAQLIMLGRRAFLRYENLSPKGLGGPETFYATSTTRGTLLGICRPHAAPVRFQATCERILATARVIAATSLPTGPIPAYATALASVIKRLNAARGLLGTRLHAAPGFASQARAAAALALAHRTAATALTGLRAGPAGQANVALARTLNAIARAYEALGLAASHRAAPAYNSARNALGRLTAQLGAAFTRLQAFGYRVGPKA